MHHHDHSHSIVQQGHLGKIYIFSILLNLVFVVTEAGVGFFADSLGLLSDAGHNLGDVFSLLLAFIGMKLATTRSTRRFTYGYRKSSVLISLLNAIILLVAVGAIIIESIHKFSCPAQVNGDAVAWTAGVGIIINGLTAWLLSRQSDHDINTRGAFLHMMADTLVSIGVLASGVAISITGYTVIDPIVSLVIAIIILATTWRLLSESLRMSIDAVPEHINIDEVKALIEGIDGITNVHHLHIWPISTTEIALTAHIRQEFKDPQDNQNHQNHQNIQNPQNPQATDSIRELKHRLSEIGITHSTIEIETEECQCGDCGYSPKNVEQI